MALLAHRASTSGSLLACASLTLLSSCLDFDRYGEAPVAGGAPAASGGGPTGGSPAQGGAPGDDGGSGGKGGSPATECGDGVLGPGEECDDALGPPGACTSCVMVCSGNGEAKLGKSCYWLDPSGNRNWTDAKLSCSQWRNGAHLAAIGSQAEQTVLEPLFTDTVWLGGEDGDGDGVWTWVTGEPFTFANWDQDQGQPNPGNSERCLGVFTDSTDGTTWHDIDCDSTEMFLCEWTPPVE